MAHVNRSVSLGSALLLAAVLGTSACTSKDDHPSTPVAGEQPTTAAPTTAAPSPTPTATPTAPATPTSSPATLTDRLLATAAVPGLNASWHWQDGETGPAGSDPFGPCARADLLSIGASAVVQRTYFAPDDSSDFAAEQVAEFPDTATAARASTVLEAWRKRCAQQIEGTGFRQQAPVAVPVSAGSATWYLISFRPRGGEELRFVAFGTVVNGTRIAVTQINNGGQDYDYPTGHEPMVAMVKAAADLLRS